MHLIPRRSRLVAISLCVGLALTAGPGVGAQETIQDARRAREDARTEAVVAAAQLEVLKAENAELTAVLDGLNEAVAAQVSKVDAARAALAATETELARREDLMVTATMQIDGLRDELSKFAVDEFVAGPDNDAEKALFSSAEMTNGVRRAAYLDAVTVNQADTLDELRGLEATREDAAQAAKVAREDAARLESEIEADLVALSEQQQLQADLVAEVQRRAAEVEAHLDDLEADADAMTALIRELTLKDIAAKLPDLSAESASGFGTPTAGGVSSGFGPRIHPIYGSSRMHTGLDIGGAMGAPIFASKAGTVIFAGWKGGYGNAVLIEHEGGVVTLYAHQSKIIVSVGDVVDKAEQIGEVGSTGQSTGPHLHFEVRVGGNPQNPANFLP